MRDLRPLSELRREEYARELRECVAFAFVAIVTLYSVLSL